MAAKTTPRPSGVQAAASSKGVIKTDVVINAAGLWGNDIANMVGITLPIIPMAHLYLITKPVKDQPHSMPTMRDPDNLVYFRGTASGMIAGGYERQPKPWGLNGVPQDWNFKLLEPDWDRFTPLMESIIKRVPSMETAEIAQLLNGPEGFTPDSEYLLGPTAVRGFWVACAFCALGIAGAGGIGKAMAEWIIDGQVHSILPRLVQDDDFRAEMARFLEIRGEASGRVTLGERLSSIGVRFRASKVRCTAKYDRIPFPVWIDGGQVSDDGASVAVTGLGGKVGMSSFSGVTGKVDLSNSPMLTVLSGGAHLDLGELYPWVASFEGTHETGKEIRSLRGVVDAGPLSLAGPLRGAGEWTFDATGTITGFDINYHDVKFLAVDWDDKPINDSAWKELAVVEKVRTNALNWGINTATPLTDE